MKRFRKFALTVPFCVALVTPIVMPVATAAPIQDRDDHDRDDQVHHRYYDPEYRDYHQWNADEERYWHEYRAEEHRPYIDWDRASDQQRRAYWRWRHAHQEHHDRDDRH
ncbi:MAG: hypothetical protein JO138_05260 [Acidobacteriaceae bacterium]|nr:hypothetical protein [Acidobacteriaceae bacterium]